MKYLGAGPRVFLRFVKVSYENRARVSGSGFQVSGFRV